MPPSTDGGVVAEDPLVGEGEGDADHEGEGEAEPLPEGGVAEVEDGRVFEAAAEGSVGGEGGGADDDSGHDSDAEGVDAEAAGRGRRLRR